MNPLISIIIPIYNHANILDKCILSISKQTYQPIEIIIVNDGSTDNFTQIIKGINPVFASSLPAQPAGRHGGRQGLAPTYVGVSPASQINGVVSDERRRNLNIEIMEQANHGASAARNKGFKNSRGEYVIFWDADTIANPLLLEKMYQILQINPQASYAYSQFRYGAKKIKSQPFDPNKLKQLNYIDTTSLLRRLDFPGFDETLKRFQDWDLWLTLLAKNKTGVFIPEILFSKIVAGRRGISSWLPNFVYKLPWKIKRVRAYEQAKKIILKKHHIN